MSAMLLSIKPQYAEMIIKGTKKYEFRTRKCRDDIKKIIFYATAPKSQVVGEAEIESVLVGKPTAIWKKVVVQASRCLFLRNTTKTEKWPLRINLQMFELMKHPKH